MSNHTHIANETDYDTFELDALSRIRDIFDHRAMALDEGIASELFESELQSHVASVLSQVRHLFPMYYVRFDLAIQDQIENCHMRGMVTTVEYDSVQERFSAFLDPEFESANDMALSEEYNAMESGL